jgi:CBS domain containing-hemolysin-like protein
MVSADDMVAISTEQPTSENFELIRETPHTRFPLVGGSVNDVVGIVYVPSLMTHLDELERGERTFADIAAPPMTVPPDLPVSDLIDRFQEEQQELAVVVDDGETVGLVTATDAFEEITGELEDPLDETEEP